MAIMKSGISRRAFLGLGATAAVAAGAGLAGCSPASNASGTAQAEQGSAAAESSWKTPPAEITDFAKEYDCDVVVCGHGFAGITACRELAEEGYKVILVEKQPEDTYAAVGNEFAALNASILKERGVPEIDPVEFFQNWMTVTGNYPNQELVMKFAQHSGENSDWYLSELSEEDFATMTTAFFPKPPISSTTSVPSSSGRASAASTAIATKPRFTSTTAPLRRIKVPSSSSAPRPSTSSWITARWRALPLKTPMAT